MLSRFALVFRACSPQAFPSLQPSSFSSPLTYCLHSCYHRLPCLSPLSWHSWPCLCVSCSFFVWGKTHMCKNAHKSLLLRLWSLIFPCCSLLSHLFGVCCLKLDTLWANCFFFSPQCLCIFLGMITPNKLYGVLYYASAVSHGAKAGLNQKFQLKATASVIT